MSWISSDRLRRDHRSLDYLMQEDYAGGLASHAGDGKWDKDGSVQQTHQDGWFRNALPFEPLCNCPESGHAGEAGQYTSSS